MNDQCIAMHYKTTNVYQILGTIKSRNSITEEWEEHYLYCREGKFYTREIEDFKQNFKIDTTEIKSFSL